MDPLDKKHKGYLNYLAWYMSGGSRKARTYEDIRSIVDLIFLQIPEGTPHKLAYRITRNRLIDELKSRHWSYSYGDKIPHVSFAEQALIEIVTHRREPFVEKIPESLIADSWEDNTVEDRLVQAMLQAVRDNPENQQYGKRDAEVLKLYFLEGINQTEVGKIYNLSRSMISKILAFAFKLLREQFTHEDIFGA